MSSTTVSSAPAAPSVADTAPGGAPDAAAAPAAPATPKAPAPAPKIKVGGRELSAEEIEAALHTHETVDQKLSEAAKLRKAAEADREVFVKKDKAGLRKLLKENGFSEEELAEEWLLESIKAHEMDPKDKELADLKAKLAERDKADEEAKKAAEAKAVEAQAVQLQQAYEADFMSAFQQMNLPKTPETALAVLKIVQQGLDNGLDISAKEAVQIYERRHFKAQHPVLEAMTAEQLMQHLPAKVIETLVQHANRQLLQQQQKAPDGGPRPKKPAAPRSSKKEETIYDITARLLRG